MKITELLFSDTLYRYAKHSYKRHAISEGSLLMHDINQYIHKCAGAHFTNDLSITIQMWWKFHFAPIQILIKWSLQYLAHGTTAGLSWHVPNFVAIWSSVIELELSEISIEFEFRIALYIAVMFANILGHTMKGLEIFCTIFVFALCYRNSKPFLSSDASP